MFMPACANLTACSNSLPMPLEGNAVCTATESAARTSSGLSMRGPPIQELEADAAVTPPLNLNTRSANDSCVSFNELLHQRGVTQPPARNCIFEAAMCDAASAATAAEGFLKYKLRLMGRIRSPTLATTASDR